MPSTATSTRSAVETLALYGKTRSIDGSAPPPEACKLRRSHCRGMREQAFAPVDPPGDPVRVLLGVGVSFTFNVNGIAEFVRAIAVGVQS